jgi:hypothetical protein
VTLIELLIVVILIPIVIGGVTVAIITVVKNQVGVQSRLSDSHDAQTTAAYFARDVQGATKISTVSTPVCAVAGVTGTQILGLQWSGTSVSYIYDTTDFAHKTLVRVICPSSNPTSVVAHGLTTAPTVVITCQTGVTCPATGSQTIWPANGVATITITVPDTTSGFSYNLLSAPRLVSTATSPNPGGSPPQTFSLILLGSGGSCPQTLLTIKQRGHIQAGAVSTDSMAINSNCPGAVQQDNNSSFGANAIYTQVNPPASVNSNPSCTGCTDTYTAYYSPNPVVDPYGPSGADSLTPPALTPPPVPVRCTGPSNALTCPSGLYSTSLGNCPPSGNGTNPTITFGNGVSEFDGCVLTIPQNGTLTTTGALLYFKNGGYLAVNNNPTINLVGMSYQAASNMALWQDSRDSMSSLIWSGGNSGNAGGVTISGTLYMPTVNLTMKNLAGVTITQVIVQALTIDNCGATVIGP